MTEPILKQPLVTEKNMISKAVGSEYAMIAFLVIVIGVFQPFYFKTQFFLRDGGDFNVISAVFSSDGLFNLVVTTVVVVVHLMVVKGLRTAIPESRLKTRYSIQFVLSGILAATSASLCMWFYYTVVFDFDPPRTDVVFNIAVLAFIIPIILNGLLETFYYRNAWLKQQYEQEQLTRQMIAVKFEALKNQLSPHFVFNSFNTLSAIMDKDLNQAQQFLEQLSHVYRYILENKDEEIVTLGYELDSVNSLLAIQETRHPGAVIIETEFTEKDRDFKIIPLTLHTLVENVFKHNSLSPVTPINLSLKIQNGDLLVVENDLRPKLDVQSFNIGLQNLSRRYELLIHKPLNIITEKSLFRVEVQLIPHRVLST